MESKSESVIYPKGIIYLNVFLGIIAIILIGQFENIWSFLNGIIMLFLIIPFFALKNKYTFLLLPIYLLLKFIYFLYSQIFVDFDLSFSLKYLFSFSVMFTIYNYYYQNLYGKNIDNFKAKKLFKEAIKFEKNANFANAMKNYQIIVNEYSKTVEAELSKECIQILSKQINSIA